ncbi:hypothetical protein [Alkanindiges illinoisensis]|uniref:hypothetical protein n=1 Tax=Alkanindiges illinoisensis TaxID=197183 RepID=UPI00047E7832|nr:hypothetical protein [Alkanindiges illinoisensis]
MHNIKKILKMLGAGVALPVALLLAGGVSSAETWTAPSQSQGLAKLLQASQQHQKSSAVIEQAIAAKDIYPVINGKAFKRLNSLAAVHQQLGKPVKLLSQGYDDCNGQDFPRLLDYGSFQVNEYTLQVQSLYFNDSRNRLMLLGKPISGQTSELEFLKYYSGMYGVYAPHQYTFEQESGLTQYRFEFKNGKLWRYAFFQDDC